MARLYHATSRRPWQRREVESITLVRRDSHSVLGGATPGATQDLVKLTSSGGCLASCAVLRPWLRSRAANPPRHTSAAGYRSALCVLRGGVRWSRRPWPLVPRHKESDAVSHSAPTGPASVLGRFPVVIGRLTSGQKALWARGAMPSLTLGVHLGADRSGFACWSGPDLSKMRAGLDALCTKGVDGRGLATG